MGLGLALCVFIAIVSAATAPEPEHAMSDYFPRGRLRTTTAADASAEQWYASTLAQMEYAKKPPATAGSVAQPALYRPTATLHAEETYRALISYGHDYLMAVRLFRGTNGGGGYVVANEIDFREQGQNRATWRQLENGEWEKLMAAVSASNFWNEQNMKSGVSTDCVDWVIEGRQGTRYNVISMSCPTKPVLKQLAELFPKLAGWFPY
jgi:hypothetical protein